jgi:hypothetical protein
MPPPKLILNQIYAHAGPDLKHSLTQQQRDEEAQRFHNVYVIINGSTANAYDMTFHIDADAFKEKSFEFVIKDFNAKSPVINFDLVQNKVDQVEQKQPGEEEAQTSLEPHTAQTCPLNLDACRCVELAESAVHLVHARREGPVHRVKFESWVTEDAAYLHGKAWANWLRKNLIEPPGGTREEEEEYNDYTASKPLVAEGSRQPRDWPSTEEEGDEPNMVQSCDLNALAQAAGKIEKIAMETGLRETARKIKAEGGGDIETEDKMD